VVGLELAGDEGDDVAEAEDVLGERELVGGFELDGAGRRAGGGFLYGTTDLAAVRFRTGTLGANRVVYFVDARQSQHFAQVFWTARQAGWADNATLEHAAFGTMLGADGKPFKTRSGDTVKLRDLLDEAEERALAVVSEKNTDLPADQKAAIAHAVGIGAVKYADLSKDRTSDYVFSFDKMLSLEGNTAPYLLYAYARTRSLFRRAVDKLGINPAQVAQSPIDLREPAELALAKTLLRFGPTVEAVARELKPHFLCGYLYELAGAFSSFYENCPVLQSDEPPAPAASPSPTPSPARSPRASTSSASNTPSRCNARSARRVPWPRAEPLSK
jgi:arginyl-tRNA synthetase